MNRHIHITLPIMALLMSMCKSNTSDNQSQKLILIDTQHLEKTKILVEQKDSTIMLAFDKLIAEAQKALTEGPFSVTHKKKLPPSGDMHDYASYSRYWWPDSSKPDGLPYIRKDGETNPASQNIDESDRKRIGEFGANTETLGIAYFLTGEEKYATKAAELIRVWFLDDATLMNPNVNHAQCRPGHNNGSKSGVLDGRLIIKALETSLLIANSSALSETELEGLRAWTNEYYEWLTTNEMALAEAASPNNHGSFYDVQAMYFALYSRNHQAAKQIAHHFYQNRVLAQIEADGLMPEEAARTRPLFYSIYNLHAMFLVSYLAERVNEDIWKADNKNSRLRAGLDYLAPYTDSTEVWPQPMLKDADRMKMFAILQIAHRAYPDGNYLMQAEKLPSDKRNVQRSNLVQPLMR